MTDAWHCPVCGQAYPVPSLARDCAGRHVHESAAPVLEKLHASFVSLRLVRGSVIEATIQLPSWQDRAVRHDVIRALAEFEEATDWSVVISPTFVWDGRSCPD